MASEGKGSFRKKWLLGLIGSLVISLVVLLISRTGLMYQFELKTYDARFIWRGVRELEPNDVMIVAIDDETFSSVPQRDPFPRSYYARLIRNLLAAGAKLIVFDVQFMEPDENPAEDADLAAACALAPDRIVHSAKIREWRHKNIKEIQTQAMLPMPQLLEHDTLIGIINEAMDLDGFTRQYQLYMRHANKNYIALAVKALQAFEGLPDTTSWTNKGDHIEFGPHKIPLMTESTMLINYYGPVGHFQTVSMSSVLDDMEFDLREGDSDYMHWFIMSDDMFEMMTSFLPEESIEMFRELREDNPFKDKIIFVGASAAELHDSKKTPFFSYKFPDKRRNLETPGVETHANAFQTLRTGDYIRNVDVRIELAIIYLFALFVYLINNGQHPYRSGMITFILAVGFTIFAFYLFFKWSVWLTLIAPLFSITLTYVATTVYHFIREQREKAMIRGMFAQYVPKKVVSELIDNPDMMALGGEKRRMTALFTDVAGFTTVSEKLTPEELVHLLNEYLSAMSKIILDNEGIIDKYEGDLIMAEWGAPVFFEDHAAWACRAALTMQRRLKEMRKVWRENNRPALYSRVGINTGDMIVGNMGCLEVFDYTVMGDAVNLASRLEGANKSYETTIMIGPETAHDVAETFVIRFLDNLRVKGKDEPVQVYELIAEKGDEISEDKLKVIDLYNTGNELYMEMQFTEAKEKFEAALAIDPDDGPSKTYLERCNSYIIEPPPEDWDRVFVLTSK